jgi:hypothetical protein
MDVRGAFLTLLPLVACGHEEPSSAPPAAQPAPPREAPSPPAGGVTIEMVAAEPQLSLADSTTITITIRNRFPREVVLREPELKVYTPDGKLLEAQKRWRESDEVLSMPFCVTCLEDEERFLTLPLGDTERTCKVEHGLLVTPGTHYRSGCESGLERLGYVLAPGKYSLVYESTYSEAQCRAFWQGYHGECPNRATHPANHALRTTVFGACELVITP